MTLARRGILGSASEVQREGVSWISTPWVVFIHVAAAFLFVMGHGASMWTSDQIRRERDPARIRALLELSSRSLGLVYAALLTLLIAGIAAGIMGGHFGQDGSGRRSSFSSPSSC